MRFFSSWVLGDSSGGYDCSRYGFCLPRPIPRTRTLFADTVEVEGLSLLGNRLVYAAETGDIDCGLYGTTYVLRIPALYLNGNCTTKGTLDRRGNLKVTLTTK